MKNYSKAFRAYDIRGIFGEEIDNYFCFLMGYGIGEDLIQKYGPGASILIGSDTRKINKELMNNFIVGLTNAGITQINCIEQYATPEFPFGIISTSAAYHIGMHDRDLTTIFTASHNPAEYTGIKAFDKAGRLTNTQDLFLLFEKAQRQWEGKPLPTIKSYASDNQKIAKKIGSYHNYLAKKRSQLTKNHHFVVDFCHGATVTAEQNFYKECANSHLIHYMNDYPDGTFPSHEGDTSEADNYRQLIEQILQKKSEFGVMFDGDGDRIGFASNTGEVVAGDIIYAIIATEILREHNNNPICIHDCMSSKIVAETIQKHGGTPKINKVGRFFINHEMQKIGALLGGEVSGHYMFGELGSVESVLLAQYYVMKASEKYNSFDEMVKQYKKYYKGQVQSLSVTDKEKTMHNLENYFHGKEIIQIDGISIYDQDYRCNIRPSNTENKIRFTVEANNQKIREQKVQEIKDIIQAN